MIIESGKIIYLNGEYHVVTKTTKTHPGIDEMETMPVRDYVIKHRLLYIDGKLSTVEDYLEETSSKLISENLKRQK